MQTPKFMKFCGLVGLENLVCLNPEAQHETLAGLNTMKHCMGSKWMASSRWAQAEGLGSHPLLLHEALQDRRGARLLGWNGSPCSGAW